MSKILFWVVVVFVVLFAVRLVGSAQARKRRERSAAPPPKGNDMVRCERCGTFVPRVEAVEAAGGYRCREGNCLPRGPSG